MSCNCNSFPCVCAPFLVCCEPMPAASNAPPSPTPPWARATQTGLSQLLEEAGNVSLTQDETYLDALATAFPSGVAITIPNGNYQGQKKQIYLTGDLALTATFNLAGTFQGFTSLSFTAVGQTALLSWNGASWAMIGGNAIQNL